MKPFSLVIVLFAVLSSCSYFKASENGKPNNFNKILKSTDYTFKLQMAEKYYLNKDYNHAQTLYDDLYRVMKGSEHFEDIWYKYAYCAFYLKDYINAENLFKGFVEAFPNSPKSDEMDYMRAFCFYKQSPKVPAGSDQYNQGDGFYAGIYQPSIPTPTRVKEATDIIEKCRAKLEKRILKMQNFILISGKRIRLSESGVSYV